MAHRICPWWLGYLLASPLRRLLQDPRAILAPLVSEGMTVLELGPGMGFFTIELARLVGARGKVVAVDVQPRMLEGLRHRATRAGVLDRIDSRLAPAEGMGPQDLQGRVDFVLAFAVVHELPDQRRFFAEAHAALEPGGRLLLAEPSGHVTAPDFAQSLRIAAEVGLTVMGEPKIARSRTAVLEKTAGPRP
jgi:SAM-dependent methyltransferase